MIVNYKSKPWTAMDAQDAKELNLKLNANVITEMAILTTCYFFGFLRPLRVLRGSRTWL